MRKTNLTIACNAPYFSGVAVVVSMRVDTLCRLRAGWWLLHICLIATKCEVSARITSLPTSPLLHLRHTRARQRAHATNFCCLPPIRSAAFPAGGDMEAQDPKPAHVFPEHGGVKRHL